MSENQNNVKILTLKKSREISKKPKVIGARFGDIEIIDDSIRKDNRKFCICICHACNTKFEARSDAPFFIDDFKCNGRHPGKDNYIGTTIGYLYVLSRIDGSPTGQIHYKCICNSPYHDKSKPRECIKSRDCLKSKKVVSCGCYKLHLVSEIGKKIKHGANCKNPEDPLIHNFMGKYRQMKARCSNPKYTYYKRYGERGIRVCDRWLGENGFNNFKEDMYISYCKHIELYGESNTTIDRINNDGNYEPGNCKWATYIEQANNRSNNIKFEFFDKTYTPAEFTRKFNIGINADTIRSRLRSGCSIDEALAMPSGIKSINLYLQSHRIITYPITIGDEEPKLPYFVSCSSNIDVSTDEPKYSTSDFIKIK